jgi:hypothetical protein
MIRQKYGNQLSQVPKRTVGQVTAITQGQRHIFFLITRQKSYNKPSYSDIESCLVELRKSCEKNRVLSLAIPRELGDGLEGLQEKHIKQVLFTVFSGTLAIK